MAFFVFLMPYGAHAETVHIQNTIISRTSTGGNVVQDGQQAQTGESDNSVSVHTEINGETVENYSNTSWSPIFYEHTSIGTSTANQVAASSALTSGHASSATAAASSTLKHVRTPRLQFAKATSSKAHSKDEDANEHARKPESSLTGDNRGFINRLVTNIFSYVSFWLSH